jgi:hypothetical protein
MPRQSITDLQNAIEAAPEMTAEHRKQLLALVESLAKEVATVTEDAEGTSDHPAGSEHLRGAIAVAAGAMRQRAGTADCEENHDLGEHLSDLKEKVEIVALEHPVVATVLTAIGRLV